MSANERRYREELVGLFNRMQEIQSGAEERGEWTDEERGNFDTASDRATEVEAKLRQVKEDAQRASRIAELDGLNTEADERQAIDSGRREISDKRDEGGDEAYRRAFEAYMRNGLSEMELEDRKVLRSGWHQPTEAEKRAQGVATNSAGGYTVPPGFRAVMQERLLAYGGLLNLANVITTSTGQPLQWPTNDDTGNVGAILAENTQISQQDVSFGTRTINAYKYTSKLVLVSWELLQDSAFDINTWLPAKLGERIGRAVSAHLVAGTGTGQPTGITQGVTIGKTGASGQTTTITYDDLVDIEHSIDPAYRTGDVRYVFNDSTLRVLRKLKDTQGRPLWQPVPTAGFPATINGIPYTVDQGMPNMAANAVSILFGNFHAGYIVRQVHDVQMVRLQERYADFLQTGFFGFSRLDGKPDDPYAIAAYKNSAS